MNLQVERGIPFDEGPDREGSVSDEDPASKIRDGTSKAPMSSSRAAHAAPRRRAEVSTADRKLVEPSGLGGEFGQPRIVDDDGVVVSRSVARRYLFSNLSDQVVIRRDVRRHELCGPTLQRRDETADAKPVTNGVNAPSISLWSMFPSRSHTAGST